MGFAFRFVTEDCANSQRNGSQQPSEQLHARSLVDAVRPHGNLEQDVTWQVSLGWHESSLTEGPLFVTATRSTDPRLSQELTTRSPMAFDGRVLDATIGRATWTAIGCS